MPDISCQTGNKTEVSTQTSRAHVCLYCYVCKKTLNTRISNVHVKCSGLRKKRTKKVLTQVETNPPEIVIDFR